MITKENLNQGPMPLRNSNSTKEMEGLIKLKTACAFVTTH